MGNSSAVWSAIAASFAALTAFLTMLIHRRNLIEAMRPELILEDWSRRQERHGDVVSFGRVRNVGRGPAFGVLLNSSRDMNNPPQAAFSTTSWPVIAPGESVEVDGDIGVWWKNVPGADDSVKHLFVELDLWCSDRREWRHKVRYLLFIVPVNDRVGVADSLIPGVGMPQRRTKSAPIWWLRSRARLMKVPLLGRSIKPW